MQEIDSRAVITFNNGSKAVTKTLTSTLAEFLLLAAEGGLEATVTLTSAQILALNTTPIELIAAPGAGKYIVVDYAYATMEYGSATYAAGGNIVLSYTDDSGTAVVTIPEAFVEATADIAQNNLQLPAIVATEDAPLVAAALTSDPTTGDSDIKITFSYRVISL
jgi:hypothetical protein